VKALVGPSIGSFRDHHPPLLYATEPFNVRRAWFYARIGHPAHLGGANRELGPPR